MWMTAETPATRRRPSALLSRAVLAMTALMHPARGRALCTCSVTIMDDDDPGQLQFRKEVIEVEAMASSTDYDELTYVWDQWRKASGNKYRWVVVM